MKVTLKDKRGRRTAFRQIDVPTDDQMLKLAEELHSARQPAHREIMGWRVVYFPSRPSGSKSWRTDPFTGERIGEVEERSYTIEAYCKFGYGQEWGVTLAWRNGDDQQPVKCNERGNVVMEPPIRAQESLFRGEAVQEISHLAEGHLLRVESNGYERNPEARRLCIEHYGPRCVVCSVSFCERYGSFASGFIHVHHLRPLSTIAAEYVVDPIADLRPVCPNCHAALHIDDPPLTPDELQKRMKVRGNA